MDNQQLLEQVLAALDRSQETLRQEMAVMKKDLTEQFVAAMNEQTEMLTKMVDKRVAEAESRLDMKIEHEVSHKIETLFDGYKLNHEKQWELERKTGQLQLQIDEMEARLAALESRIA